MVNINGSFSPFIQHSSAGPIIDSEAQDRPIIHLAEIQSLYDASIWKVADAKPLPHGGLILSYRLPKELDEELYGDKSEKKEAEVKFAQKQREIFPAIEPDSKKIFNYLITPMTHTNLEGSSHILRELGFSYDIDENGSTLLHVPNRVGLEGLWNDLKNRREDLKLPDFPFSAGENIAGDREFIEILLKKGVLASDGRETLHDMMFHVLHTIVLILSEEPENRVLAFQNSRNNMLQKTQETFNTITKKRTEINKKNSNKKALSKTKKFRSLSKKEIKTCEKLLSAALDLWSAQITYEQARASIAELPKFPHIVYNRYSRLFIDEFSDSQPSPSLYYYYQEKLKAIWEKGTGNNL